MKELLLIQSELKAPKNQSWIYSITNPKWNIYVGSSNNLYARFRSYKSLYKQWQHKLYNSLIKYWPENHKFDILEYCEIENLYKKEREWGLKFNVLCNKKWLNCILPGDWENKKIMSEETKRKIWSKHKWKKISQEHLQKIKLSLIWKKQTEEHIEKRKLIWVRNPAYWNSYFKWKKHTEETKKFFSKIRKGRNLLWENPNSKKVIDTKSWTIYSCAKEISIKYNINYSTLKAKLNWSCKNDLFFRYI